jgi:signal transduction histidine kinase
MMFVNYREPQVFTEPQKRLIQVFAAQAASVIYYAKTWERNNRYWEMQRADSLTLSVSEIVSSLAHNSGNLVSSTNMRLGRLQDHLNKINTDTVEKNTVSQMVNSLSEPLSELTIDFRRLRDYRRLNNELQIGACDLNDLIQKSLSMMRVRLENQRIHVDITQLNKELPSVLCDQNQIQHVLLNLFLNAVEAMGNKGTLSVATKKVFDSNREFIQIRVSDTGPGIALENRDKIFSPSFTTKKLKEGSGMGLPISQYIVINHGGKLEFTSVPRKNTSFLIYLPLQ